MNTQSSTRNHTDHTSLVTTGTVGDFVRHEAQNSQYTERITSILIIEGIREITVKSRITAYRCGGYQRTVETTIHQLQPNRGPLAAHGREAAADHHRHRAADPGPAARAAHRSAGLLNRLRPEVCFRRTACAPRTPQ